MIYLSYLMAVAPFAFLFYLIYRSEGVKVALGIFGVCGFIVGWIGVAFALIDQAA